MIEEQRAILFDGIEQLFKEHEGHSHLVLEHRIFLNATDKNDPEIESLKMVITDLTFSHPCWGEKMPKSWIPLELEIAELVAEGKHVISFKELDEINKASEVSILSPTQLKTFLRIQHSLGKILFFDNPRLRDYVIINPLYLVGVMKSFVTDKHFWPSDGEGFATFHKMSSQGIIKKEDLFSLWNRPQYSSIFPYKEFIFDLLIHLDILSEQRRYDLATGVRLPVEEYFVPCMVVKKNTTDYMDKKCVPSLAIGLAFVFKGTVVPPALPNRLISACLNIWALKCYKGEKMLFSGLVVLSYNKHHEVVICVETNKILLYIVHDRSRGLIVQDIASSVRECMLTSLERISDFYQRSINSQSCSGQQLPFNVCHVCNALKCHLPKTDVMGNKGLICTNHGEKYEIDVWYEEKNCSIDCKGLSLDALNQIPSDPELFRLSKQFGPMEIKDLSIHLGLTLQDWKNMEYNHPRNIEFVKFRILAQWREQCSGTFQDLAEALIDMGMDTHPLCQVRRIKRAEKGIQPEHWGLIPTDQLLDALASDIGMHSFPLGIELGLTVPDLEVIQSNFQNDLIHQTRVILQKWRNEQSIKATLGFLQQALINVGKGTMCLQKHLNAICVKGHKFQHLDEYQDCSKQIASNDRELSHESNDQFWPRWEAEESETSKTGVGTKASSRQPVEHTEDFDIIDGHEQDIIQSIVVDKQLQDLARDKSETLQTDCTMLQTSTRKRKLEATVMSNQQSKRTVGPACERSQTKPSNREITDNDKAIRAAFQMQNIMKDILEMNKEQLETALRTNKDTIELLQNHGSMETNTVDDMRLALLTLAKFNFYSL